MKKSPWISALSSGYKTFTPTHRAFDPIKVTFCMICSTEIDENFVTDIVSDAESDGHVRIRK